jgi:hypothetical protein
LWAETHVKAERRQEDESLAFVGEINSREERGDFQRFPFPRRAAHIHNTKHWGVGAKERQHTRIFASNMRVRSLLPYAIGEKLGDC